MADKNDREIAFCVLSKWTGGIMDCRWCDEPLPKGRRRWCSDECNSAYLGEHLWGWVNSQVYRERNGTCEKCGINYDNAKLDANMTVDGRDNQFHSREGVALDRRGRPLRFEVHHITPLGLGRSRPSFSCLHHKEGLLLLCLACHNDEHTGPPSVAKQRQRFRESQTDLFD